MDTKIIRLPQVKEMVGLGTTAIYDKMKNGDFPKQIKLGRLSGWVESEVQAWINKQIMASRRRESTTDADGTKTVLVTRKAMNDSRHHPWTDIGLPAQITQWLDTMSSTPKGKKYIDRAQRLAAYSNSSFENAEELRKAWAALERAANSEPSDALTCIFMLLPDQPERAPFDLLYGKRFIDPGEEKARYDKLREHVIEIETFMNPHRPAFENMLRDSTATPDAHVACSEFREVEYGFFTGLKKLRALLDVIEPAAKIPTKHWKAEDAGVKNYAILVAALNRYLSRPQHAALAVLARANCPSASITADQLRKAWASGADKRA